MVSDARLSTSVPAKYTKKIDRNMQISICMARNTQIKFNSQPYADIKLYGSKNIYIGQAHRYNHMYWQEHIYNYLYGQAHPHMQLYG